MLNAIASLFGYLMNFIYLLVQNYGLAIIIFTILVKLLLLPLTIKQQKSLERAQEMQPLMQELQRKYGNDQQKFAEEYQKLLKEKNMGMMSSMGCSGCLLNLIQFPILLGMFYMMMNPLTHIMKLDSDLIEQYKNEVNDARKVAAIEQIKSSGDSYTNEELEKMIKEAEDVSYVNPRYYELDIIKDKEIIDMNFLGINLCDIAMNNKTNKLLIIIPILSTVFTYLSLYISTSINKKKGISTPKPEDSDIPMPDMRVMNIMMPLMTGYVAYSVPQGVGLYWATSNLLGVIQISVLHLLSSKKDKESVKNSIKNEKSPKIIETDYKIIENNESTTNLPDVIEKNKKGKKKKSNNKKKKK